MPRAAPASLGDGWPVSAPGEEGLDGDLFAGIAPQFEAWTEANVHAILIARNGRLVYERYFAGEDQAWGRPLGRVAYDEGMFHDLRSITKSVTSLLVGIALDRGWLAGLDIPVFDLFPEHADLATAETGAITLRHLLTMSAGWAWSEDLPYSDARNSERQMIDAEDPDRYVLARPLVRPPGAAWVYNGGCTQLLASIVARAAGRPLDDIARTELFEPIGIDAFEWVRHRNGQPMAASGLRLRPRDVLRVGQLALVGGLWQGERIVAGDWVERSLAAHINGQGLFFYGYHWWLGRSLVERREVTWAAGVGWGGQRLFVVPSRGLVVLVMAGLYDNPPLQPVPGEVVLRRYALAAC
jgi:CubicO group peptidase (beta-lactamase class C family)